MGFLKFTACLALGILVLYQVGMLQAASFKPTVERNSHRASLSDEEGDLLLAVLVEQFMKMMAREKELVTQASSVTPQKRACNTGTCLTHKLAGLLSKSGSVAHTNLLPPGMVTKTSGRKGRDLDA